MDFSANYTQRVTVVLKEAAKLKKYKAMPPALAIVTGILMLPVAAVSIVLAAFLYVLGYLFSIVSLPTQKLHKILHDEGQSVMHATQFIIYFLSWSFVFSAYAVLTFFLIILTVLYSLFSIFAYICTLGGFKFHVFAKEEDISVEVDGQYNILLPIVYIAAMGVLLILLPLAKTIVTFAQYGDFVKATLEMFMDVFKTQIKATGTWRFLLSVVYSAVIFAPNPKKKIEP